MKDPRIELLARQVIEYSVSLQPGEKVLIEAGEETEDLALALVQAAYRAGGYPYVRVVSARIEREWLMGATEESVKCWYEYETPRMKDMDAYIAVRCQENIYELSDVPADRMTIYNRYHGELHNRYRMSNTKWCVLRYPNASMAQLAGMSMEAFENLYFRASCLDYRKVNQIASALSGLCSRTDQVRIIAPGTDLSFSIKGMCQEESLYCGVFNRPCGETGMNIVQGSANGTIRYNIPSSYQGTVFSDVELTLKDGVVVDANSNHKELMNKILDTDPGARRIGEFAIGFNPVITSPITDTLFDEKMAMSLHFTPGNGLNNPSAIHWDLVQSHAPEHGGGEIWFDDVLIRKDGLFVVEELLSMNPEEMIKNIEVQ